MPKRNKPNPLSNHLKNQSRQINQLFGIGGSMADNHFHKMYDRTGRWLDRAEEKIEAINSRGETPSKLMQLKLGLLHWIHRRYRYASLHSDGTGFVALFFGLLVALGFISLLSLLYVLLAFFLIWAAPHIWDWFFSLP